MNAPSNETHDLPTTSAVARESGNLPRPKVNSWRIAGRTFGVVSFLLISVTQNNVFNGLTSGLIWWGVLEFIGWMVDRNQVHPNESPQKSTSPETVFTRAEDLIVYEEYQAAKQVQIQAEEEARRVREQGHKSRLDRENAERAAQLKKERIELIAKSEREKLELQTQRAKAYSEMARKVVPYIIRTLICLIIFLFAASVFFAAKSDYDESISTRAAKERTASEHLLAKQKSDEEAEWSRLETERLLAERADAELQKINAESDRLNKEKENEFLRLSNIQERQHNVQLDNELIDSLRETALFLLDTKQRNNTVTSRENSNPNIIKERKQIIVRLLNLLHHDYESAKSNLPLPGDNDDGEWSIKPFALESLYTRVRINIQNASLSDLRKRAATYLTKNNNSK